MAETDLFRIETDQLCLSWSILKRDLAKTPAIATTTTGLLRVKSLSHNNSPITVTRINWPATTDLSEEHGPHVFEQTDYAVNLTSKNGGKVSLTHRDPQLIQMISQKTNGTDLVSLINYRSQVGYSDFTVLRDGVPEFAFTIEVFPTKLEYRQDFVDMLTEVQEILTSLALEFLKSTYNLGISQPNLVTTGLEWLILLKSVADDLERALLHVSHHPVRGIRREQVVSRTERIRKVDSSVRTAVRRGSGAGDYLQLNNGLILRRNLPERRAQTTLDTPEHRWFAAQLSRICQRIAQLKREESLNKTNTRRQKTIEELDALEMRMRRLATLEPLAAAEGEPPAGFSSLQLQGASGYREAFQKCIILMLGLRIEGGPLKLSAKDVSELYEYWCFIALLRLIEETTGAKVPSSSLFKIRQQGVRVMLEKGRCTAVPFALPNGRSITAEYNPQYKGDLLLASQRPDIVLTLKDPDWPPLKLVLDAKYRIDSSEKYREQYNSPGPPEDALNVLHRYRDAILEEALDEEMECIPKRSIVQAAALFPYRDKVPDQYRDSRLWKALEKIGVGAVPLLPGNTEYLSDWLLETVRQGGWSIAERAIGNIADRKIRDWRQAAAESVLVASLRSDNPQEHFDWIRANKMYYIPLKSSQRRFHEMRWIAFYLTSEIRSPGAVAYWARIDGMEVKMRKDIPTPWTAKRDKSEHMFVYRLGEIQTLDRPIENKQGIRVSGHRWTSRLGLLRSSLLHELSIETEPEWRLYESLKAVGIKFSIAAGDVKIIDREDPRGRAWIVVEDRRVQYRGSGGFIIKVPNLSDSIFPNVESVIRFLK